LKLISDAEAADTHRIAPGAFIRVDRGGQVIHALRSVYMRSVIAVHAAQR
jgi:hypothetical protein